MIGGLLLALVSAGLINLGFLLQHRGLTAGPSGAMIDRWRHAIRDPSWLCGQAIGWMGFALQLVAVAIAPLALVQAFAAGGLALSVPLAAGIFHHPVSRSQVAAVLLIAVGLAALTTGLSTGPDHLRAVQLIIVVAVGTGVGLGIGRSRAPWARAVAAGIFYGLADGAIKAVSLGWHGDGVAALASAWTLVALAGTFGGFLAFQSALEHEGPVAAISLMNALAALVALVCGLLAFGESLGTGAGLVGLHVAAIAAVLFAVPVLAAAQAAIAEGEPTAAPSPRPIATAGRPRQLN